MAAILSVSSHRDVSVAGQAYPISDQKRKTGNLAAHTQTKLPICLWVDN